PGPDGARPRRRLPLGNNRKQEPTARAGGRGAGGGGGAGPVSGSPNKGRAPRRPPPLVLPKLADTYRPSSPSRLRWRICSFSAGLTLVSPCSHVTGDGCQGTNGQSLPRTTRSAPTWSRRKRSAASLPTTVS